jgi:hypothetical protein
MLLATSSQTAAQIEELLLNKDIFSLFGKLPLSGPWSARSVRMPA